MPGNYSKIYRDERVLSSRPWQRLRKQVIAEQGGICARPNCEDLIDDVDHIIRKVDRPDLMYVRSNLEGLCKPHHKEKTRQENGG